MKRGDIIDIGGWLVREKTAVGFGTRQKKVFKRTKYGKVYYIAKTYNKDIGELRSEVCATNIGKITGFSVQKALLCTIPNYKALGFDKDVGVLIQLDVRRQKDERREQVKENLIHAMELITEVEPKFAILPNENSRRNLYTLDLIIKALRKVRNKYKNSENLWQEFFELMVFDALIGGTDRHYRNWGILINAENEKYIRLTPAFDNGISLMWSIERQKRQFLDGAINRRFVKNAPSAIRKIGGGQYKLFELCEELSRIPEIKKSNIVKKVGDKVLAIREAHLKRAILDRMPRDERFNISEETLILIYEYAKMRLEVLKETICRLK